MAARPLAGEPLGRLTSWRMNPRTKATIVTWASTAARVDSPAASRSSIDRRASRNWALDGRARSVMRITIVGWRSSARR